MDIILHAYLNICNNRHQYSWTTPTQYLSLPGIAEWVDFRLLVWRKYPVIQVIYGNGAQKNSVVNSYWQWLKSYILQFIATGICKTNFQAKLYNINCNISLLAHYLWIHYVCDLSLFNNVRVFMPWLWLLDSWNTDANLNKK